MHYEIVTIDMLLPLEKVFPTHFDNLEKMIDDDGFILKAIIAERGNGIILDGSHRYVYFLKHGYKTVPVHWVRYYDEDIRVGTRLSHRFLIDGYTGISKKECIRRGTRGDFFPPRTTRHFFPFRKIDITLPLNQLEKGESKDVSYLIADVDVSEEITHSEKYIREIDEEVDIIINYLSEVSQTKKYLTEQINLMKKSRKIAFFPGKFHPPHLGHLKTLLDLSDKYSKLIIGVSEHVPDMAVITVDNIMSILKSLFRSYKDIEIVRINGVLIEKDTIDGLPKFDVLLSGNPDVLSWAKDLNIQNKFIPRAEGDLFSGTEVRNELHSG